MLSSGYSSFGVTHYIHENFLKKTVEEIEVN